MCGGGAVTEIRYDLYELGLLWNADLLRTEQVGFGVALGGAIQEPGEPADEGQRAGDDPAQR